MDIAEPSLHASVLISSSTLCRWEGDLTKALAFADEAKALADKDHMALESITARAAAWAAHAGLGQAAEAVDQLQKLADALQNQNNQIKLLQVLGLCAHAALLNADPSRARRALETALQLAQTRGSAQTLVAEVIHTPRLETFVRSDPAQYELIIRDLDQLREAQVKPIFKAQTSSKVPTTRTTDSLRIMTLGQEAIERDEERIQSSEWRATTARELFFYLLFSEPQSREQISLVFWPDSSSRRVRQNFHTTLYRVRQALGENVITFQDGLYLINPDIDVWCDANELESLTLQARLLSPYDARTEDLWRRAIKLYRGDFLKWLDADWVIPRREAAQQAYIEALVGLGDCMRTRNDQRGAVDSFERALVVDPYREDIRRAAMKCYDKLGEPKHIRRHYLELREMLSNDLAIEPAAETIALYETLLN